MPIFEYRCLKCDHVSSFLEPAGRKGKHACAQCGSDRTEKVFSTFAARAGAASSEAPPSKCSTCPSTGCPYSGGS